MGLEIVGGSLDQFTAIFKVFGSDGGFATV